MQRVSVDYDLAGAVRGRESWEAADEHRVVETREALVERMLLLRRGGQPPPKWNVAIVGWSRGPGLFGGGHSRPTRQDAAGSTRTDEGEGRGRAESEPAVAE